MNLAKASRIIRMFKLVRLLRVARISRVINRLEYTARTQEAMRTLWKFVIVVIVSCHLFTCAYVSFMGPLRLVSTICEPTRNPRIALFRSLGSMRSALRTMDPMSGQMASTRV